MEISVEHIGLPANDPHGLADWYVRVLGAKQVEISVPGPPLFVALQGAVLEIYNATDSDAQTSDNGLAGFRHLALRVTSIADAKAKLERKGVLFPEPPKPATGGGHVLFFRDPEGNLLHFVERPPGFTL
ncbi:MAG: VOC family protein [Gloeobacteraceae cyanobacterium ES-bin-144]|nr:VOC family protein [Verrucomicrobiales bacterium]